MSEKSTQSSGTGVLGLLGIAFIVLKLCNVITWSWWYVTMPFWGPLILVVAICPLIVMYSFVTVLRKRKRLRK